MLCYSTQRRRRALALSHGVRGNCGQLKGWSGDEEGGEGEKLSLLWLLWEGMGRAWRATTELDSLADLGSFCSKEEVLVVWYLAVGCPGTWTCNPE